LALLLTGLSIPRPPAPNASLCDWSRTPAPCRDLDTAGARRAVNEESVGRRVFRHEVHIDSIRPYRRLAARGLVGEPGVCRPAVVARRAASRGTRRGEGAGFTPGGLTFRYLRGIPSPVRWLNSHLCRAYFNLPTRPGRFFFFFCHARSNVDR
jgi:hypothetical protein